MHENVFAEEGMVFLCPLLGGLEFFFSFKNYSGTYNNSIYFYAWSVLQTFVDLFYSPNHPISSVLLLFSLSYKKKA